MLNPYLKLFFKPKYRAGFEKLGIVNFYNFDAKYFSNLLKSKEPDFWERGGEKMALSLFKSASVRIPAYKKFLKKYKIKPEGIKTIGDFKSLPVVDKNNYLKKYPPQELCWDGKIENETLLSVSSGSSGAPFFWPRSDNLELESGISHEMFLKDVFMADKRSTLFIVTFSMGIYIAGVITLNSVLRTSQKNYPITTITPGISKDEILRTVKDLGDKYEQIIIAGYPPFVKDCIDKGEAQGINWRKCNLKFLFATEGFSERWRDYIFKKTGVRDKLRSSLNIYGSADAGILGHETPLSILVRRIASENIEITNDIFQRRDVVPTFVQYNPLFKYYEEINKELIFSAYGGIPLIRYNIHDSGGIKDFNEIKSLLGQKDGKIADEMRESWKLPFIYVFGKSDFTASLYGVNIYPENIKFALEDKFLDDLVTGKFLMQTKNKKNQDQYLEINIELKEGVNNKKLITGKIKKTIIESLEKNNLEYNRLRQSIKRKADPNIVLRLKGDSAYFSDNVIKQKWFKS